MIKNTLLIFTSFVFALLICEIFLRIAGIGFGNAPKNPDPIYHHSHPKNYKFTIYVPDGEFGGWDANYDNNGFVTDTSGIDTLSNDSEEAIVFLGDSFTEANQVPYDHSFVQVSGDGLNRKTINMGVSSYSPVIYLSQVRNFVNNMSAKDVVLQLYSNDYQGDQDYLSSAIYNDDRQIIGINGGKPSLLVSILRSSYVVRLLRRAQLTMRFKNSVGADISLVNDKWAKIFSIEQNHSDDNIAFTHSIVLDIQKELEKAGKNLHVLMIPSKALSKQGKCCNADTLYETFKRFSIENEISFIDLNTAFENAPDQSVLFYETDIHLTTDGHLLVGKTLADYFESVVQ